MSNNPGLYKTTQTGTVTGGFDYPPSLLCHPIDSLQGFPVAGATPTEGQILSYSSEYWGGPLAWRPVSQPAPLIGYTTSAGVALGYNALYYQSVYLSGYENTGVGYYAGYYHQGTGSYNAFFGAYSGAYATNPNRSTYIGAYAGYRANGLENAAVGYQSMYAYSSSYTPQYNACLGAYSGYSLRTCSGNTLLGYYAGYSLTSGSYNTIVGSYSAASAATGSFQVIIGDNLTGKGNNTTLIGSGYSTTDTWIRGNTLHVGNENASDKFWYFQKSASGVQPGFKWNNATTKLQWSHDGTTYVDFEAAGASSDPYVMSAVCGMNIAADDLVYLDDSQNSGSPGIKAFSCPSPGLTAAAGNLDLESGAGWTAPTQPYVIAACAVSTDTVVVAYRYGTSLRIRAANMKMFETNVLGAAVDLAPDGASNEVAYVSIVTLRTSQRTNLGALVAWVNPTTNTGYLAAILVQGTTVTVSTPVTFTTTGCLGTALAEHESFNATNAMCGLAWADVASNSGRSRVVSAYIQNGFTPTVSITGSVTTFTSLPAAEIGQPTFRGANGYANVIMFGISRRQAVNGFNNSSSLTWYPSSEARVDQESPLPTYVLDANSYSAAGDFFHALGDGVLLVQGTKTGYTDNLYLVETRGGYGLEQFFQCRTQFVRSMQGSTFSNASCVCIGSGAFYFAALSNNAGGSGVPFVVVGLGKRTSSGLVLSQLMPPSRTLTTVTTLLGSLPQHTYSFFEVTDNSFGYVRSYVTSGVNKLTLTVARLGDPTLNFAGIARAAGAYNATINITRPGGEHTFTTAGATTLIPGRGVYVYGSTKMERPEYQRKTAWYIGVATANNKVLVVDPSNKK